MTIAISPPRVSGLSPGSQLMDILARPLSHGNKSTPGFLPPAFNWIWGGQAVSLTGSQLSTLSFQLIAVNLLRANAMEMGVLAAADTAPYILFGLFAGVLVDRCSRFRILVAADAIRSLILLSACWLDVGGRLSIHRMWVIVCVTSTINLTFDAALGAHLTELIDRREWLRANSRLSISTSGSVMAGPAIAGYILQVASTKAAMFIDAATYVVSAMCIVASWNRFSGGKTICSISKRTPMSTTVNGRVARDMGEGMRFVFTHPILRVFAFATAIWNLCWGAALSVLVLFFVRTLGLSSRWVGLVMAAGGMGGVLGGASGNLLARRWSSGRVIVFAPLVATCGAAMLLAAGKSFTIPILAVGLFLFNAGQSAFGVIMFTCRQEATPRELLGRMDTTMRVGITCMASLGAFMGGFIASRAGVRTAIGLGVCGLFFVVTGLKCSSIETLIDQGGQSESPTV